MSRQVIIELSARHGLDADELLEAWSERAAISEYLGGSSRRCAELWAVGDVEAMYGIGLHCPETRRRMLEGGQRSRPSPRAFPNLTQPTTTTKPAARAPIDAQTRLM